MYYEISDEWSWCFIFLVCVIIFTLILVAMIHRYTCYDEPNEMVIMDASDLRTGDILGVSYNNVAGGFTSGFSRSIWSHTGIVWIDPETSMIYVLEGAQYPIKKYKGAMRIPFYVWYSYNSRFPLGIKKYIGEDIDPKKMIEEYSKYEGKVKLEGFNPSWGRFLSNRDYKPTKINKSYTCFELTILLLQDMEIYKKEKMYCSFFPGHIMNGDSHLEKKGTYKKTKKFELTQNLNLLIQLERKKKWRFF